MRFLRAFFCVVAVAIAAGTFLKAVLDVSTTWDVWYYHLPFAARIWGIVPVDVFAFHEVNQHRFDGFPLLAEAAQGLLWAVFRRPEAANLVAFGSLIFYVGFLKRTFRIPLRMSTIALLAVPLVQMHASACYIDLPANLMASTLVMATYRLYTAERDAKLRVLVATIGVAAAATANMRFQLLPLVAITLAFAFARLRRPALLLALPVIFATPLKNLLRHHNPLFPMKVAFAGITLPYVEEVYSDCPPYLAQASNFRRWLYSILEVGIRPMSDPSRWTVDQWMPSASEGNRMGGFFGAYVVLNLAVLGWLVYRERSREMRVAVALFVVLTALTALMPQSHELRYYLYWMVVTITLNLILLTRRPLYEGTAYGLACTAALSVVLFLTDAWYVRPSRYTFEMLVQNKVKPAEFDQIHEGDRVCIYAEPWTILYASTFHRGARSSYALREGASQAECGAYRFIE